ncbi:hypothetical protein [Lysobacter enzymogenes]|uniref:hypothetical protein n=1 Tax=Lysobacter enzymogenes TaxID=69 RepID=UPI0011173D1B|nr:hypothetical protein [Lysobacter enzymogenes]UZW62557.1 hypothetical protein BV903_009815 [Lysobacter enzymogenes]
MTDTSTPRPYFWTPGTGPDPQALQRLRALTRLPKQAMGEAWFMSENRGRFFSLMHDDPRQWPELDLRNALFELSSGISCFGPRREWQLWCAFLLPRSLELLDTIDAYDARHLHPALVTATLMNLAQPAFPHLPPPLSRDLLDTLGRAMFAPSLWLDGRICEQAWCRPFGRTVHGDMIDPSHSFAASCTLALKLLDPAQIPGWLASALAIDDPYWRAAWVVWLHAAAPMILDGLYPDELDLDEQRDWKPDTARDPNLAVWEYSHTIRREACIRVPGQDAPAFIDPSNRHAFVAALRSLLGRGRLEQWSLGLFATQAYPGQLDYARRQYAVAARDIVERYGLE